MKPCLLFFLFLSVASAWTTGSFRPTKNSIEIASCIVTNNSLEWSNTKTSRRSMARYMTQATTSESATGTTQEKPTPGSVVTIDCKLIPEGDFVPEPLIDGVVLHESDEFVRLQFVLGFGNYLPGLHDCVSTMTVGETREAVSLDAGWGARNPNLEATVKFTDSGLEPAQIKVGVELLLQNMMKCVVTEVSNETFTIDANPPLAGASYAATVKLINVEEGPEITEYTETPSSKSRFQVATFALGCFWGGELEFMRQRGVVGTAVGYTQGDKEEPTYEEVCSGSTGHTESILVMYDPDVVSYQRLVQIAMDRLGENRYLLNQVGNDKGTQYRHGVYYHSPQQKTIAEKIVSSFGEDCVTECLPAKKFWMAEDYHQQYLLKGGQSAKKGDKTTIRCYG